MTTTATGRGGVGGGGGGDDGDEKGRCETGERAETDDDDDDGARVVVVVVDEEEEEEVLSGRGMTPEEATALCEALAEDLTHLFDARGIGAVARRTSRSRIRSPSTTRSPGTRLIFRCFDGCFLPNTSCTTFERAGRGRSRRGGR